MGNPASPELESELKRIADYIVALRREIGALQANEIHQSKIPAAGEELAAVVSSTEGATNEIMSIAEGVISADANDPSSFKAFVDKEMMAIFEACAFQDLTGQRIGRVVRALEHIEARVSRFANYTRVEDVPGFITEREAKEAARKSDLMLHGPLTSDERNTQTAIDELFAGFKVASA